MIKRSFVCLMLLVFAAPVAAAEGDARITIGKARFLKVEETDRHAWGQSYKLQVVHMGEDESTPETLIIDDLDDGKLTTTDILQCDDVPHYDRNSNQLSCKARIGPDFFCEYDYKMVSKGPKHHLQLLQQRCFELNLETGNKLNEKLWKRSKAN